jgi:hypothetical protein
MVVELRGKSQRQMDETLVYMESIKKKKRAEEARDLLRHHPLTPEQAIVVDTEPFLKFFPCNHIINIKKKFSFSGEARDSVVFSFYFLLHKRANHILPPWAHELKTHPHELKTHPHELKTLTLRAYSLWLYRVIDSTKPTHPPIP